MHRAGRGTGTAGNESKQVPLLRPWGRERSVQKAWNEAGDSGRGKNKESRATKEIPKE